MPVVHNIDAEEHISVICFYGSLTATFIANVYFLIHILRYLTV